MWTLILTLCVLETADTSTCAEIGVISVDTAAECVLLQEPIVAMVWDRTEARGFSVTSAQVRCPPGEPL